MWPFDKRDAGVIRVHFFDEAGKEVFAAADLPVERLPASFEARTTMQLAGGDWEVVEARPMTAAEFGRTGKLVLVMRPVKKVERVSPGELLFSLPTISEEWPPMEAGSTKLGKETLTLHEDDWRQVEWVEALQREAVDAELAAIREIYEKQRVGVGFRTTHARSRIPRPLENTVLPLAELLGEVGADGVVLEGISVMSAAGVVAGGWALRMLSPAGMYGVAHAGRVGIAGFRMVDPRPMKAPVVGRLAGLAARHGLLLVDWCGVRCVEAEVGEYEAYFSGEL